MPQRVSVSASARGNQQSITFFSGEALEFAFAGLTAGQSVIVAIGPNLAVDPTIQREDAVSVKLSAEELAILPIGDAWQYMLWLNLGDGDQVVMRFGNIVRRESLEPVETAPPALTAPAITGVPTVAGTEVEDQTLTATAAPVTGNPTPDISWQWQRDGVAIAGAVAATHQLVAADVGAVLTVVQTATNSVDSASAESAPTGVIAAAPPALTAPAITGVPTVAGTEVEGETLTATAAPVTGNPAPATSWQWERDGVAIAGAVAATHQLVAADVGAVLTVVQTATNSVDSDSAESAPTGVIAAASVDPLAAPQNLFTATQADFTETSNIDLRDNWTVGQGDLRQIVGNGSTNDVRFTIDTPMTVGAPHFIKFDKIAGTAGRFRPQLSTPGFQNNSSFNANDQRPSFTWITGDKITSAHTQLFIQPMEDSMDAQFTGLEIYDLSSVDPNTVACDVVLCLGDSNMSPAVSDLVTAANLTTPYDPRVFYMPALRDTPTMNTTMSARHVPQPCYEPVQAAFGAVRMSPLQAFGARFAPWSAARGRPLLLLSLGDAGSGFFATEDWVKGSTVPTTGARMYGETLAMLTAMRALGPAHEIVGAIVSLGANDTTGSDYNVNWVPAAQQFVSDLRSEADIGDASLPVCWITVGEHYEPIAGEDRGARLITAIESMADDSGSPNAVTGVTTVRPPVGNALAGPTDPHFNAAGMQANGVAMADGLITLLNDG